MVTVTKRACREQAFLLPAAQLTGIGKKFIFAASMVEFDI
jgi:hypothetical protein